MTGIDVRTTRTDSGWTCRVKVYGTTPTDHAVQVSQRELERLDPGATDPTNLVRRAFEFLLEREPNTSILPEFDLPVIARYFPEFERKIRSGREDQAGTS
jgi:hypothetical protein